MKIKIFNAMLFSAGLMAFASCSENSWNDKLDGFEEPTISDVQTVTYSLTAADYKTLAGLSDNKAIAGETGAAALAAIGTQGYFSTQEEAAAYIPALIADSSFPYFTLDNGSSVNITYDVAVAADATVTGMNAAKAFTVTDAQYLAAWGGNPTAFVRAFSPANPAAGHLQAVLAEDYPDAAEGSYAFVQYNEAEKEPEFNPVVYTDIDKVAIDQEVTVKGVVSGVCAQGFMLTDETGTMLVYGGKTFDASPYLIGQSVSVSGMGGTYNGGLQLGNPGETIFSGAEGITYPEPFVLTGAQADAKLQEFIDAGAANKGLMATYVEVTGTVTSTGKYCNFSIPGAAKATGSLYQAMDATKEAFVKGEDVVIRGWLVSASSKTYVNICVTELNGNPVVAEAEISVPEPIPSPIDYTTKYAAYTFDGTKWSVADCTVLQAADYRAMGQNYDNFSDEELVEADMPIFLKQKYPYSAAEDVKYVAYRWYADRQTSWRTMKLTYDGSAWQPDAIETVTSQFVKAGGKWNFDPSVVLNLVRSGDTSVSKTIYQACVDWVYENIDVPLGSTSITSGAGYVTKYGNNEYYSGTSAYRNDVDLRVASARGQYAAGYEGMTDEEALEAMKTRFAEEVMPGALSKLYPDANTVSGVDVTYTVNFVWYDGSNHDGQVVYKVVGKGQFELVEQTW